MWNKFPYSAYVGIDEKQFISEIDTSINSSKDKSIHSTGLDNVEPISSSRISPSMSKYLTIHLKLLFSF